ncbi:hypothetical protein Van01_63220 [Micromonospora andamanensis]|uniref:Uncharacterized protein n=1 Tax=Micromonospora andamanensis TaxID=1287068 RepID=A0ABQ4I5D4_9ACTN|nr:hypothetical protein Van01_63220 [Micromonospora andamanensis]
MVAPFSGVSSRLPMGSGCAPYETVRNAVTLRYPDGQEVPEFLLHLDGDEAWWRWSDEPFDEQNA